MSLSPTLNQRGSKVWLSCPVEIKPPKFITNKEFARVDARPGRVCAVDVGINTAVTAVIVDATGTVIARGFFTHGRHNDRRDELAATIADKQSLSGSIGKLSATVWRCTGASRATASMRLGRLRPRSRRSPRCTKPAPSSSKT